MTRRRAHYVLSTHWDREWYMPAQAFRYRLVQLLDAVLDAQADGRLAGPFQTDGQSLLVEDYLEARPGRRAEVEAAARAGMLAVGPWYSVPDEFLVSGESLVRNLRMGLRSARALGGEPSRAGWVCDQFGHIGQLPQIFAGFDIGAAFLWRGVNETRSRHFRWRGADGTVLPTYRFGGGGYCSFAFRVRQADRPDLSLDHEELWENLEGFLAEEAAATEVAPLLVFDGGDHLAWDERAYGAVRGYAGWAEAPVELAHTSLDAYMAELLPEAGAIEREIAGELREPASMPQADDRHWLIPGVLSSRVWIKQENAACESLLTQWAEPLGAWASLIARQPYQGDLLEVAWRWLLQNHPHDSMGGCSVDLVHEDMRYRFSQCRQIAGQLADAAAGAIAAGVGPAGDGELRVVVFNPLPAALDESAELTLDIPADWPTFNEFFGFEPQPAFRIYGLDGAELPYQRIGQAMGRARVRLSPLRFPDAHRVNEVRVSLRLRVPALGYVALTLRPGELDRLPAHPGARHPARPTRHPRAPGMASSERSMENALLSVAVEPNGSLTLTDKRSGAVYSRLLTFEDGADIGDGWYHGVALADEAHTSTAAAASVALICDGPQLTSFRIRTAMRLPARFDFAQMRRSEDEAELLIDSVVSLRPDSDRVEVETTVRNTAADHRLRVRFPSGATSATTCLSDGAFDVVERPIALRADNHGYRELEVDAKPQQSWTAVQAGGRGLAVVTSGLLEAAVIDQPERPIALTLLRSTRRTVMTDGEPGGLMLGETLRFRYWVVPLAGPPDRARLCALGQRLAAGLRVAHLEGPMAGAGGLPPVDSLLEIAGPAVLSSLLRDGDALELRLFNPEGGPAEATLRLPAACRATQRVSLEGRPLEGARPAAGGRLTLSLGPKEIVSLRLIVGAGA